MFNVIILGSTGMIGNLILQKCLARDDVKQVTVFVRKSLGQKHPKLTEVVHNDFMDFSAVTGYLKEQDICFYCVGVYTGQVPREEFRKITIDYTVAFARALKQHSEKNRFCFLSGQGADQSEKSRIMFAKDKGIAENMLIKLRFYRLYIFRPSYIYPVTPRKEPGFLYKAMRVFYPFLNKVYHWGVITSEELAKAMTSIGFSDTGQVIFENKELRKYAETL